MTEKVEKRVIKPTNIDISEYSRTVWQVKPAIELEIEDLLKPDYWAHVAIKMKPGDRIEAIPEDKHYFAEFFVMACASNWAKVKLLRIVTLIEENDATEIDGYTIKWAGPHDKFRVLAGNEVISKGHADKESAMQALNDHIKTVR
jgi:hypothetical protein